jgi:Trypsin-like peptidase domain
VEEWDAMRMMNEVLSIYVGMALILPGTKARLENKLPNGTFTFVDTGRKALLVTAQHVYQEFLAQRDNNPNAILGLGTTERFENVSDAILIDQSPELDLAVLELRRPGQLLMWGKKYLTHNGWPPPRPQEGEAAYVIGYPGAFKHAGGPDSLNFRHTLILDSVSSVRERYVSLNQRGDRESDPSFIVPLTGCGGMSGGAFLTNVRTGRPRLSGIVYEAFPGCTDIIYASHADFIHEDGSIARDW